MEGGRRYYKWRETVRTTSGGRASILQVEGGKQDMIECASVVGQAGRGHSTAPASSPTGSEDVHSDDDARCITIGDEVDSDDNTGSLSR